MLRADFGAEDSVIGQLIVAADTGQADVVRATMAELEPQDFVRHREAFVAMVEIVAGGELPDTVQLGRKLGQCDALFNALEACEPVFTLANIRIMAKQLASQRKRADLAQAKLQADKTGAGDDFAKVAKIAQELAAGNGSRGKTFSMRQVAKEVFAHLEQAHAGLLPEHPKTGFSEIDDCLGGLQPGGLTIVAARPGVGKTAFALNIAERACVGSHTACLIVSCEMTKGELFTRLLAQLSRIPLHLLRTAQFKDPDWAKISKATMTLDKAPLTIWDGTAPNLNDIAKALDVAGNPKILIVDYLQLCTAIVKRDRNDLEIQEVSQGLKAIAKERQLHVIALSQLNRENDTDRPKLSGLRGSGSIEQDADAVMLLSKSEDQGFGMAEVLCDIAKNRHGPLKRVQLRWLGSSMRFEQA